MKGGMKFAQTREFSKKIERVQTIWPSWLLAFLREQADDFLERVRERTPVDSGRLVSSWKLEDIGWVGTSLQATFINDANDGRASYASFVEYGHAKPYKSGMAAPGSSDWVLGYFMLTYTVEEMQSLLPSRLSSAVNRLFNLYLG